MAYIRLHGKTSNGAKAIVDDEDVNELVTRRWHMNAFGYAVHKLWNKKTKKYELLWMHRVVNKTPPGLCTDHINHNKIDNRKSNLRTATKRQNAGNYSSINKNNTSGSRGVGWDKKTSKWRAYISILDKQINLGRFTKREDAERAYTLAAKNHFGEFISI